MRQLDASMMCWRFLRIWGGNENRQWRKMTKLCPICNDPMVIIKCPQEYSYCIPFTQIEIIVRAWNGTDTICMACYQEKHESPLRSAYNEGKIDGYNKGYDDGLTLNNQEG